MTTLVTGIGVVAPNGLGADDFWAATLAGRGALSPVRRFDARDYPARLAGEVPGFDAAAYLPSRLLPQTDHMTRLALVAADWALADAGVGPDTYDPYDMGVITASSAGGFEFGQRELRNLWSQGSEYVSAYQAFAWFYAVNTGQISIRHQMKGPSGVVVTDQAGGLDALAQAHRQLVRGSRLIVSGGVDGSLCPWGWVAQLAGGRLSTSADPDRAFQPFDDAAAGHVPGEGGAILVLEDAGAAAERGAPRVYGELAGYAATFDPLPGSGRPPGLRRAIEGALDAAGVEPAEIDIVFADAAAVPELDQVESDAITAVFGPGAVPVTAPKTMTGRLYAGGGALDVVAALLAIRDGVVPPTVNVERAARHRLDLVTSRARPMTVSRALVLARGHGGFNSALVVRAAPGTSRHANEEVHDATDSG
ncbi:putative Actinorhodin polyketide beta-ketoacyl synthase 2 [Frankia canadensis]|uniref:Putative Actinorhodin polyketide beta-ketoacyl synthase 2 n=1 Tax=Frankia canadensis TaxID=1836972 RepID=A0A2I2KLE3_9ACTN|nr:ketosynthase chain-length factor [Frankia canadensis]SNQ46491.1 putative Actinorhodin polyketide beta-ketoacyl synthase 2 [Frankia canadensis]SOU53781.1 putative Actinorhodin polyketide beta-ketoacyl synthase 2 [Frankia canadensis]